MFQDYLLYATDAKTNYAFRVVHLTELATHAAARHNLVGSKAVLLGETLASGILLASVLETEELVNLRIQCGSEFTLASETTCHGQTRGYIEAQSDSPTLKAISENKAPRSSVLVRTLRSYPRTTKLNEGITESRFESISQVVNEHLETSFQSNLKIRVESWWSTNETTGQDQLRTFGVIYFELPNLDESLAAKLRSHAATFEGFQKMGPTADDPDLLARTLIPNTVRPVNSITPVWQCTCSQGSVEAMLLSLGGGELASMAAEGEPVEIECHYCKTSYQVSVERLQDLSLSPDLSAKSKQDPN